MTGFPYELSNRIGTRATLGLIVLQVDETIEHDFRRLFSAPDIALHISRIPSGQELTPDTIAAMRQTLPDAVRLLPPAAQFDSIGYACTSGTTLIGTQVVADLVHQSAQTASVADPLSAAIGALHALNAHRVAIVSPYIESVATPITQAFDSAGFMTTKTISFGEEIEARVARINPASIYAAALAAGQDSDTDAVFLSCTNLRTLDILEDLETDLGKPVISSNQVLAWQMAQHSRGLTLTRAPGRLFHRPSGQLS